ncbi:hypothetical protein OFM41_17665, partial [Escherichia coli]|nr:hypothetical protein [Escherichia coli]
MLPGCCKNGIVISKIPVMQAGLKEVMRTHFPEYEIISSASAEDLTGNDSNLLIVFYVQIMPDDFVMQLHR